MFAQPNPGLTLLLCSLTSWWWMWHGVISLLNPQENWLLSAFPTCVVIWHSNWQNDGRSPQPLWTFVFQTSIFRQSHLNSFDILLYFGAHQDLLKIAILLPQELKGCQPPLSLDLAGQYKRSSKYIADEHSMDHVSLAFGCSKGYLLVFFQWVRGSRS